MENLLELARTGVWRKIKRNGSFRKQKKMILKSLNNSSVSSIVTSSSEHNYARSSGMCDNFNTPPKGVVGEIIIEENNFGSVFDEINDNPNVGDGSQSLLDNCEGHPIENVTENMDEDIDVYQDGRGVDVANVEESESTDIVDINVEDHNFEDTFRDKLSKWAINNQIKRSALNSLLILLREYSDGNDLPLDGRTLVGTPRDSNVVVHGENNKYWHYGLKRAISDVLYCRQTVADNYSIDVNIDGLPLFRSSSSSFWPILIQLHELRSSTSPSIVGIYCGKSEYTYINDSYVFPYVTSLQVLYISIYLYIPIYIHYS